MEVVKLDKNNKEDKIDSSELIKKLSVSNPKQLNNYIKEIYEVIIILQY